MRQVSHRVALYTELTVIYAVEVSAQTNSGGTRISGGAVAGIVIGVAVLLLLIFLAFASPYSPWKRRERAEGAEEEANEEKAEGEGNREGKTDGNGGTTAPAPGMPAYGANGVQAGGAGAGAMYPQIVGVPQTFYTQPNYGAPGAQQSAVNNAPYVPTFPVPNEIHRGY